MELGDGLFRSGRLCAGIVAGPDWAQNICPGTDIILDLAQVVLTGRDGLNRFEQGRIGAEAACLALHYDGPTGGDAADD